ncbi:MAG: SH3 domain-containing protein [Caldilineaceae bacterium]|nr:SH3 domain-containing protein [Caldilineaceae bacterium]
MVLLAACGRESEEATPTPTKTPAVEAQTEAQPAATATPIPPAAPAQAVDTPASPPAAVSEPAATATSAPQTIAIINTELLNVRNGPSTNDEVISTVARGEEYVVIGRSQDGEWIQLAKDGRDVGWVSAELVTTETRQATADAGQTADAAAAPSENSSNDSAAAAPAPAPAAPTGVAAMLLPP